MQQKFIVTVQGNGRPFDRTDTIEYVEIYSCHPQSTKHFY